MINRDAVGKGKIKIYSCCRYLARHQCTGLPPKILILPYAHTTMLARPAGATNEVLLLLTQRTIKFEVHRCCMLSIVLNSVAVNSEMVALSASSCDWSLVTSRLPNSCSFLQVSDLIFKSFCASTVVIECFKSGVSSHAPAITVLWVTRVSTSVGAFPAPALYARIGAREHRTGDFRKSHDGDTDQTRQFYEYHYVSNPFPPAL